MNTTDTASIPSEAGNDFSVDRALVNAFLHNVPDHVYFKDLQSRFITASTSQLLVLGCSTESEIRGRTDFDFFNATHSTRAYED